jgi:Fic family protein
MPTVESSRRLSKAGKRMQPSDAIKRASLGVRARPLRADRIPLANAGEPAPIIGAHAVLYDAWRRDALHLDTLCKVHFLLSADNPASAGRLRDHSVVVRLGGRVHYRPPEPSVAIAETTDLIDWLTHAMRSDVQTAFPVALGAEFFARLTGAHPFDDGNGRVARTAVTWLLATCGYGFLRVDDLRAYFYRGVDDFYDTLVQYQRDRNPAPWHGYFTRAVSFCLALHIRQRQRA